MELHSSFYINLVLALDCICLIVVVNELELSNLIDLQVIQQYFQTGGESSLNLIEIPFNREVKCTNQIF